MCRQYSGKDVYNFIKIAEQSAEAGMHLRPKQHISREWKKKGRHKNSKQLFVPAHSVPFSSSFHSCTAVVSKCLAGVLQPPSGSLSNIHHEPFEPIIDIAGTTYSTAKHLIQVNRNNDKKKTTWKLDMLQPTQHTWYLTLQELNFRIIQTWIQHQPCCLHLVWLHRWQKCGFAEMDAHDCLGRSCICLFCHQCWMCLHRVY